MPIDAYYIRKQNGDLKNVFINLFKNKTIYSVHVDIKTYLIKKYLYIFLKQVSEQREYCYIFANCFNVWLISRQLISCLLLNTTCCDVILVEAHEKKSISHRLYLETCSDLNLFK